MEHLDEDQIEAHLLGRLDEASVGRVENHLLTCSECRDRHAVEKDYIDTMKTALRSYQDPLG